LWDINSFDQEGVQLGKVLAGRFLKHMQGKKTQADTLEMVILQEAQLI